MEITEKMNKKHILIMSLIILLAVFCRLYTSYPTDFDTYWIQGQAESIQVEGSALWVLHPASLFGYYPLSYPSGIFFFLATVSSLTSMSMTTTVFIFSIFVSIAITLLTYLVSIKIFNKKNIGYLSAVIVALSPILIFHTAFNAHGRTLIMIFYLLIIYYMIELYETKKKRYALILFLLIILSIFTHRTSQLISIIILSGIIALIYIKIPNFWKIIQKHKLFHKHIKTRYEKNKYFLLLDLTIIASIIMMLKIADLISRGRLDDNIESKLIEPITKLIIQATPFYNYILLGIGILILTIVIDFLHSKHRKRRHLFSAVTNYFHKRYHEVFKNPEKYFHITIILITIFFFILQFLGKSFYAPSLNEFYTTDLLSGTSPPIIFANFMINYSTAVTPFFIFFLIAFIFLIKIPKKDFKEWMIIFMFIGFIGILLDKNYVRLFIVPIIGIISGYGIYNVFIWIKNQKKIIKVIMQSFFFAILFILIIITAIQPFAKLYGFNEENIFEDHEYFWKAGEYLKSLDCNCSTITTKEQAAGVSIFASSVVPGGSHNVYYFVDKEKITAEPISFSKVKDTIISGSKLTSLWELHDWRFGGQYYVGRHTSYLFQRSFFEGVTQSIMKEYNEKYYFHDKNEEEPKLYLTLIPYQNKLYDNPKIEMYDLTEGRK